MASAGGDFIFAGGAFIIAFLGGGICARGAGDFDLVGGGSFALTLNHFVSFGSDGTYPDGTGGGAFWYGSIGGGAF